MRTITTIMAAAAVLAGAGATYAATHTGHPESRQDSGPTAVGTVASVHTEVPDAIAVPAGQRLVASADVVQGSQVYTCAAGTWTLLAPDAVLSTGRTLILHTQGPQWTSASDGSSVTGQAVASVARRDAVPELLLRATANRGTGLLGDVDFVQRLDTRGGVAPTTACTDGQQQAVGYHATYRFFAPAGH